MGAHQSRQGGRESSADMDYANENITPNHSPKGSLPSPYVRPANKVSLQAHPITGSCEVEASPYGSTSWWQRREDYDAHLSSWQPQWSDSGGRRKTVRRRLDLQAEIMAEAAVRSQSQELTVSRSSHRSPLRTSDTGLHDSSSSHGGRSGTWQQVATELRGSTVYLAAAATAPFYSPLSGAKEAAGAATQQQRSPLASLAQQQASVAYYSPFSGGLLSEIAARTQHAATPQPHDHHQRYQQQAPHHQRRQRSLTSPLGSYDHCALSDLAAHGARSAAPVSRDAAPNAAAEPAAAGRWHAASHPVAHLARDPPSPADTAMWAIPADGSDSGRGTRQRQDDERGWQPHRSRHAAPQPQQPPYQQNHSMQQQQQQQQRMQPSTAALHHKEGYEASCGDAGSVVPARPECPGRERSPRSSCGRAHSVVPARPECPGRGRSPRSGGRKHRAEAPNHYFCPITQDLMFDPVLAADGFCYDRDAITRWLASHDTSPLTNEALPHKQLIRNHALRSAIMELQRTC